jgi:hypothetical protein
MAEVGGSIAYQHTPEPPSLRSTPEADRGRLCRPGQRKLGYRAPARYPRMLVLRASVENVVTTAQHPTAVDIGVTAMISAPPTACS